MPRGCIAGGNTKPETSRLQTVGCAVECVPRMGRCIGAQVAVMQCQCHTANNGTCGGDGAVKQGR